MARSEEFLNLYRQLEELLRNRYAGKRLQNSSPFFQFLNERESQPFKDDLNACREMRNILSHCTDIHGDPPLEPSEGAITLLREVVEYLKQPPRALDYATQSDKIFTANFSDNAAMVMEKMIERGFSHIPVLENGLFFGMFSISTLFSATLEHQEFFDIQKTVVGDFKKYLPIENHIAESFMFFPRNATLLEVKSTLGEVQSNTAKRLATVLITNTGRTTEPLLGLLTPWDVLGKPTQKIHLHDKK